MDHSIAWPNEIFYLKWICIKTQTVCAIYVFFFLFQAKKIELVSTALCFFSSSTFALACILPVVKNVNMAVFWTVFYTSFEPLPLIVAYNCGQHHIQTHTRKLCLHSPSLFYSRSQSGQRVIITATCVAVVVIVGILLCDQDREQYVFWFLENVTKTFSQPFRSKMDCHFRCFIVFVAVAVVDVDVAVIVIAVVGFFPRCFIFV